MSRVQQLPGATLEEESMYPETEKAELGSTADDPLEVGDSSVKLSNSNDIEVETPYACPCTHKLLQKIHTPTFVYNPHATAYTPHLTPILVSQAGKAANTYTDLSLGQPSTSEVGNFATTPTRGNFATTALLLLLDHVEVWFL